MARDIGPKIGIDGEAQYRKEINEIIQQAKTLDAEMKALTTSYDKEADAKKKNSEVSKKAAEQIEVQKDRIKKLEEMVQRSAEATGENSTETNKWKEALANAKTQLILNSLKAVSRNYSVRNPLRQLSGTHNRHIRRPECQQTSTWRPSQTSPLL